MTTCPCGNPIPPQQGRSRPRKYCTTCHPPKRTPKPAEVVALPERRPSSGSVTAATERELQEAGRDGTADGVVALHLAGLLDAGDYNAQGAAALSKAHREALAEALKGAVKKADVIDDIFARRDKRRGS